MESRGLLIPEAKPFGLGYVEEPAAGHKNFQGWLSIPYLRWSQWRGWSVASVRFRRLDNGSPKYMTLTDDKPRLFNTNALTKHSPTIAITEGEIDAITAQICGIPAVGVPGATMWQPYFSELFLGYRDVFILADGDDPGMQFASTVAKTLPNAKVIPCPPGSDVNSLYVSGGREVILERLKH